MPRKAIFGLRVNEFVNAEAGGRHPTLNHMKAQRTGQRAPGESFMYTITSARQLCER